MGRIVAPIAIILAATGGVFIGLRLNRSASDIRNIFPPASQSPTTSSVLPTSLAGKSGCLAHS